MAFPPDHPGVRTFLAVILLASACSAAHLSPETKRDFDRYVRTTESGLTSPSPFSAVTGGSFSVRGGLIHHWCASAFVAGAKPEDMLALLQDYERFSLYYAPEVVSSHALSKNRDTTTLAMRLRKQKIVTVVLDAEYEVQSGFLGSTAGFSTSRSTHIWQIRDGKRVPEGDGDGFLWALNAYWNFIEGHGGLWIECEAVSLTRDVPPGLGWLILPIVKELPRTSLEFTLAATTRALKQRIQREKHL